VRYISTHHAPSPLSETDKIQPPPSNAAADAPAENQPDTPQVFLQAQRELARDLIIKSAQIQILVQSLPGIGHSEQEQEQRLRELEVEMKEAEEERLKALEEREKMLARVEAVLIKGRRP
jgi:mediator of RNA polymerase II transcription subunit 21